MHKNVKPKDFWAMETRKRLTCPRSIVRLTSVYFDPLERGGLCHQRSVPSMAFCGGCDRIGSFGSQ